MTDPYLCHSSVDDHGVDAANSLEVLPDLLVGFGDHVGSDSRLTAVSSLVRFETVAEPFSFPRSSPWGRCCELLDRFVDLPEASRGLLVAEHDHAGVDAANSLEVLPDLLVGLVDILDLLIFLLLAEQNLLGVDAANSLEVLQGLLVGFVDFL